MKTNDDIESYLLSLDISYDSLGKGLWLVHGDGADIVVAHRPPVVVFRVKIADVPTVNAQALFHKLLQLNAKDLVHGAYGIEDGVVVLTAALQSENMDMNEFQATQESLAMAVADHRSVLRPFLPAVV